VAGNRWELNLDREIFLAQYWQRKPLLIRNAIANFTPPVSSDELAGLALELDVESRIIERCDNEWRVHHGPFTESDFVREAPWTLLVQAVDHYVPEVAALRRLIDFIPQWRLDDVMVSYATDGGSVGPHFDNYDVFLLQGEGERLWQLGPFCDASSPLLPHEELRILNSFTASEEHLLQPGDMLYVPPAYAHWAPDEFYRDAGRSPLTRAGEITPRDMDRALAQLQRALDQASGNQWFGELITEPRYTPLPDDDDLDEAQALLEGGAQFVALSPAAKLAWQHEGEGILVFANGQSLVFDETVLPSLLILCESWRLGTVDLDKARADPGTLALLDYLLENGAIYVQ
jgi:50S ribosomal protein L16 3-hydroxylase